ncbi:hypothetical protein JL107_14540 [Nakamurella flavida]|uniref:Uncharacterized protein n=1 Tax=Nakamurella flavida TaxID=363630 RepID=A0A938YKI9_9ACTN|nr:hypothetical protein [Nakamurella flavida]MBM9477667.1 hypothetical protein [Nakamurella flavida]MDP9779218.1 hypothetical protein [Nakamurella flavida]
MKIDWASLGLVAVVTIVAAALVVGIYSLGVAALSTADAQGGRGAGRAANRPLGYACMTVSALIVAYGIYLIVPAFH